MGKLVANEVLDAALNHIKNNADTMVLCEGEPADYSDATTLKSGGGHKLADVSVASGDFTGPADGDTSGRKLTMPGKTFTISEAGSADHMALVDDTNSVLLHVTTMTSTSVSASETRDTDPYDEEIEDPS